MTDFSFTKIESLIIHNVGNKLRDEGVIFSEEKTDIDEKEDILLNFYLRGFKNLDQCFKFHHPTNLSYNIIHSRLRLLFEGKENSFIDFSKDFARHLYDVSSNPKIKSCKLHIVYFKGIVHEGEQMDAIGIFKSDTKEQNFQFVHENKRCHVLSSRGFMKVSQGCIIYNTNQHDGYKLSILEAKSGEEYWRSEFLNVVSYGNEYDHTQNILHLCKKFIFEHLPQNFEIEPTDQIGYLNKIQNYMKEDLTMDVEDFSGEVFEDVTIIEQFDAFKKTYEDNNEVSIPHTFEINDAAVKLASNGFKKVLKLDKNFHIYLHGDQKLIEKGKDETNGMNYYKLYFNNEQ